MMEVNALNIIVFPPIPSASVMMASKAKPGLLKRTHGETQRSPEFSQLRWPPRITNLFAVTSCITKLPLRRQTGIVFRHSVLTELSDQLIQMELYFGVEGRFRFATTEQATAFCS